MSSAFSSNRRRADRYNPKRAAMCKHENTVPLDQMLYCNDCTTVLPAPDGSAK